MIRRRMLIGLGEGMVRIAYLGFTGKQCIDTGIIPNTNTVVRMMFKNIIPTGGSIIGYGESSDVKDWRFFNYNRTAYFDVMSSRISGSMINEGTIYELELGNYYVKNLKTGSNILTGSATQFTGVDTIKISSGSSNLFYYVQIFDGNTMIMDLVPVKIGNVGYMYDRITRQLLRNTGSGDFELSGTTAPSKPIMTSVTNPEVLAVCYAQGWCSDPDYMTFDEAVRVTEIGTVFQGSNITHFEEFEYFTSCSALGSNAFNGCSSLRRITMSESVTDLGQYTFRGCSSLEYFKIPSGVTVIKNDVFQNCTSCEIELHDNIVSVWSGAFENTNFVNGFGYFPNVSRVDSSAFSRNKASELYFGGNLTSFGSRIFNYCPNLKKVTFMGNISDIPYGAFGSAWYVDTLVINSRVAPTTNQYAITQVADNGTLYVPCDSSGYDSGDWAYLVNNKGWTIVYENIYPKNFVPVEYLQSAAWTCRLNTGVVPSISKKFIVDGLVATDENVTSVFLDSAWSNGEWVSINVHGIWNWAELKFSDLNHHHGNINTKSRHIYEIDANGSYIDGNIWSWTPSKSFEGYTYTVNLFCDTAVRIYNFKVKDDGVLTMNLVPVRNGQTGCMYDTVSGRVFYNNYSGNFILGPDI